MQRLRRGFSGGWSLVLVLALLWAPTLGLMHRQVHVAHGPAGTVAEAGRTLAQAASAVPAGWLGNLFASHSGTADCQLFDHCHVADTLPVAPTLVPAVAPSFLSLIFAAGQVLAREAALYDARAPPPVR